MVFNFIYPLQIKTVLPLFLWMGLIFSTLHPHFISPLEAQKGISLTLWEFPRWKEKEDNPDRFYWVKNRIEAFHRLYPDTKVSLVELSWKGGEDKLKIAAAAGAPPDLCAGVLPVEFVEMGWVENLDDLVSPQFLSQFIPSNLDSFRFKKSLYGLPWYSRGSHLFFNQELQKKWGLPDPEFTTWVEFQAYLLKILPLLQKSSQPLFPLQISFQAGDYAYWPLLIPESAWPDSEALSPFLNPDLESRLQEIKKWKKIGILPLDGGGASVPEVWKSFFLKRELLISAFGSWAIPPIQKSDMEVKILPYPGEKGPRPSPNACSGFYLFKQKNSQKRKRAFDLLAFLVEPNSQRGLKLYGTNPSAMGLTDLYTNDPLRNQANLTSLGGVGTPAHPVWKGADEIIQKTIQSVLTREDEDLKPLLRNGDQRLQALLNRHHQNQDLLKETSQGSKPWQWPLGLLLILWGSLLLAQLKNPARLEATLLFGIPLLFLTLFNFFPVFYGFLISFQKIRLGGMAWGEFCGLENYRSQFSDPVFLQAFKNTLIYTFIVVPGNLITALGVSLIIFPLSNRLRGFFKGAFYIPGLASAVVIAIIWRYLLDSQNGWVNLILALAGISPVHWLTGESTALMSIIFTALFRSPGGAILIYTTALEGIPREHFEAASIEGATPFELARYVLIPAISRTTLFLLITMTIDSFQVFAQVLMLTDGGPGYSSTVLVHRIYTAAFRDFDFGGAAAMSFILCFLLSMVCFFQNRLMAEKS